MYFILFKINYASNCIEGMLCEDDSHRRQLDIQELQLLVSAV